MINKMNGNSFHLPVLKQIWSADNRTVSAHQPTCLKVLDVAYENAISGRINNIAKTFTENM